MVVGVGLGQGLGVWTFQRRAPVDLTSGDFIPRSTEHSALDCHITSSPSPTRAILGHLYPNPDTPDTLGNAH